MITKLKCSLANIYFIYNIDINKIEKELNKVFTKGHDFKWDGQLVSGNAFTMNSVNGSRTFFFWIDHKMNKSDKLTTLIHELTHIIVYVSRHIKTDLNDSDGEWTAYWLEDLFEQSLQLMKKYARRKH